MQETWKDIEGYEGYYQISNYGQVKGLARTAKVRWGALRPVKEKIRTASIDKDGYMRICLTKDAVKKYTGVHRLVAVAFVPNPDNKPEVNHINGIKNDNRIENLEWVTGSENILHAHKTKLKTGLLGIKNHFSKLTESTVREIRKRGKYATYQKIADDYNMSLNAVLEILKGTTWKHI